MFISKMMSVKKTLLVVVAFGCLIEQSVVAVRTRSCDITLRSGKKVMHAPTVKERVKREQADQRHDQAAQVLAQVQVASTATPMVVAVADDYGVGAVQAVVCDACASDGYPLHCAAENGHYDCVKALLFAGADENAQDAFDVTPLHCAAKTGHDDSVRVLLLQGADVNAQDEFGVTPLLLAARNGHTGCVEALLAIHGVVVNIAELHCSWGPLHWAAERGHVECLKKLLAYGADVNKRCPRGLSQLHCAAENGHDDCVTALIWAGAGVNARDLGNRTPLHGATREGDVECVQVLLTAGADWRLTDIYGKTAADVACVCYHGADRDQRIKQIRDLIRSAPARTSLQVLCALAAARHQVQLQENEVMPQAIKDFLKQLGWYDGQTGGGAGSSSK